MLNLNNKLKVYFYLLSTSICFGQIEIIRAFTNLDFDQPVDLQSPNDNSNRLFIVEQEGEIYVFENFDSNTTTTQFLDIRDKVIYDGERGLLGLAFHPNYENNGYFFINYTAPNPLRTVIAKYEVSTIDSNIADEQSEIIIIEIDQPYSNHNGGQIAFGPDGYLYIGMGDGGSGGDPLNHGQNLETLLGAMLRIDINNSNEEYNYSIPIDNPYINNNSGSREEIYAHGLRNPWRFSFDNITGDCWIADVGQNEYEEIDILEYAGNYGWRIMEGFHCFDPATDCDTSELILPIFEYDHNIGESITGGYVYRGTMLPSLIGHYIFADFEYGDVYSLDYNDLDSIDVNIIGDLGSYSVTSFGIDQNNEIYICDLSGEIYKLVDTNEYIFVNNDAISVEEDSSISANVIENDLIINSPSFILGIVDSSANGNCEIIGDSTIFYTPNQDYFGSDTIFYQVASNLVSDTGFISISVTPVNDAPQSFSLIYPTITDTIPISTDSDETIAFYWEESIDVDGEVNYVTTVTLDYFGETYTDTYESNEPIVEVTPYEWAVLMNNLNLERWTLQYDVEASDEEYTIEPEAGEFVFQNTSLSVDERITPLSFRLHQNYPNPFNPITTLKYELPKDTYVDVIIYDMLGNVVNNLVNANQSSGYKSVQWNATNNQGQSVSAGVYLYSIEAGVFRQTKKMVLLK